MGPTKIYYGAHLNTMTGSSALHMVGSSITCRTGSPVLCMVGSSALHKESTSISFITSSSALHNRLVSYTAIHIAGSSALPIVAICIACMITFLPYTRVVRPSLHMAVSSALYSYTSSRCIWIVVLMFTILNTSLVIFQ